MIVSGVRDAPASLTTSAQRRSQRSTSAPAIGENAMNGSIAKNEISVSCVADPVRWNTHTPSAKPVSPEPRNETNCPDQIRRNARIPRGRFCCSMLPSRRTTAVRAMLFSRWRRRQVQYTTKVLLKTRDNHQSANRFYLSCVLSYIHSAEWRKSSDWEAGGWIGY